MAQNREPRPYLPDIGGAMDAYNHEYLIPAAMTTIQSDKDVALRVPEDIDQKPSSSDFQVEADSQKDLACIACTERFRVENLIALRCGHRFSVDCLHSVFARAMRDETAYPPRCCYRIALKLAQKHLPRVVVREFQTKQLELATKNKTYCHKTQCSHFVAPHSIHNDQAICQKCGARICSRCRLEWHFGPCPEGDDLSFIEVANERH